LLQAIRERNSTLTVFQFHGHSSKILPPVSKIRSNCLNLW